VPDRAPEIAQGRGPGVEHRLEQRALEVHRLRIALESNTCSTRSDP
jgi:hypothetical protein